MNPLRFQESFELHFLPTYELMETVTRTGGMPHLETRVILIDPRWFADLLATFDGYLYPRSRVTASAFPV